MEDKKLLGQIEEVFGPVTHPHYTVRFASNEEVPKLPQVSYLFTVLSFFQGTAVYAIKQQASIINVSQLMTPGTDASGEFDEELGSDVIRQEIYSFNIGRGIF